MCAGRREVSGFCRSDACQRTQKKESESMVLIKYVIDDMMVTREKAFWGSDSGSQVNRTQSLIWFQRQHSACPASVRLTHFLLLALIELINERGRFHLTTGIKTLVLGYFVASHLRVKKSPFCPPGGGFGYVGPAFLLLSCNPDL